METERLTYNVDEASKILGLSRNACYLACVTGQLPHLRIGKRILIPRVALEKMLSEAGNGKDNRKES